MRAFFCDPHSPWQRGGIENANGLIRRDLPCKASLADYTDDDIDAVIWNLNSTPRKCLGYRTPIEAFAAQLGVAIELRIQLLHLAKNTSLNRPWFSGELEVQKSGGFLVSA